MTTLIADIRSRYTSQKESVPRSSPQIGSSPTGSDSISTTNDPTPTSNSSFDTKSSKDLVPLSELKKGARKRILFSTKTLVCKLKLPCVLGSVSHTRAHRNNHGGNPVTSGLLIDLKTRFRVKPFSERKLLKGNGSKGCSSYLDLTLKEFLHREMPINFPGLIVFVKLGARFTSLEYYSSYDARDYFETRGTHPAGDSGGTSDIAGSL
ncbi:hypothetical protein HAX54_028232 [Datura stramonium]|uniref:Uncharacterized protein n=1 Tax=Datura stramonium TaxID=4076 RepID=A0ABS8S9F4_DATST|nr:hypothetical protein [Datura stramonium]